MKKFFGITFGGLQRRTIELVLLMLTVAVIVFGGVTAYQNNMLAQIVGETRIMQQQAISQASEQTMNQTLTGAMIQSVELEANVADNDFAEVVKNTLMLQTMAQGLFENRDSMLPASFHLPDAALDGEPSAMVLFEEGVDYTQSEYLGIAAHMSSPMIAMQRNSEKIDGCYIGLADGTDLCVDDKSALKLDEKGSVIPFPVRERPWYTGAVEAGELTFTGIVQDAFSGKYLVTCSAPVIVNGELIGVVGVDIILESMVDFLHSSYDSSTISFIINENGDIILSSESGGLFSANYSEESAGLTQMQNTELKDFAHQALAGTTELAIIEVDGKPYYMAGSPMKTVGWAVITAVDKAVTEQPEKLLLAEYDKINEDASREFAEGRDRTTRTTVLVIAIVFLLGAFIALRATRRMVGPIEEMTKDIVKSSRTGQLFEMKDVYRTNDEIEMLAEAFDDLSRKTKSYIGQITAITAEKERISTELNLATKIQAAMMPHIFPPFPDRSEFDIFASMDPAKEVGGDFYDYFLIDSDHLCMVMADVSGKGVPAALFMMVSKIILQSVAMLGGSPAEILTKTNEAICSNNQEEMFVTAWVGILQISTGVLTAANAGHEYPALKAAGSSEFELFRDKHGLVIGALKGAKYKEYQMKLEPGTRLFLYTDGVPEASDANNELFGNSRMLASLNRAPENATPEQIIQTVSEDMELFVQDAEQFDDVTMLCLEYRGGSSHED